MVNTPCNYCGNPASTAVDNEGRHSCIKCLQLFNTCHMCTERQKCDFETNPSSLPKQVQKTVRQGNMVMQTVEKNPARIDISCKAGCLCFSEEFGCLKQNGTCGNYTEVIPK